MPHTGPILEGKGATDYERYVRVPELLELQKPIDQLSHPEERLFQVMHQTAELWLHHIDYEIDRAVACIEQDSPEPAADLLHRSRLILDLLREQIVILETMAPVDYHVIRTSSLGRGSGQESPGFNRLLPWSSLMLQLTCLPDPFTPANGFSCVRHARPYFGAIRFSISIVIIW